MPTRPRLVAVGALLLAMLTAACSGDDAESAPAAAADPAPATLEPTTTTLEPTTTTTVPATTTTIGRRGSGEPVTIAFGGDTHFEGMLRERLAGDPLGFLDPITPLLTSADLAVVNLETAITDRGSPEPKTYTFRAPASALATLADAGVDVVSMANNHGIDFGAEGLDDSLAAKETSGFPVIGIGRSAADAYAGFRTEVKGQRIAIIAATQVLDDELITRWTATDTQPGVASAKEVERLTTAVGDARATSDTVVVFLHWGVEGQTCPSDRQQELARRLVDAGADVIVGGHAHRLQGAGRLDAAFVAYGLGNFIWYSRGGPGAQTGVLVVTVTGRDIDAYQWYPAEIRDGVPRPLAEDAAATALASWEQLRGCAGLAP